MKKFFTNKLTSYTFLVAVIASLACACASSVQTESEKEQREIYSIATRQLPPEPVYNPVRWVRPPQVNPDRDIDAKNAPIILPVIHFKVENASLKEAAIVLAGTSRYRSYCASSIAKRKVTMELLGTIEELAQEISIREGIKVVVDHDSEMIRFLANT